MGTPNREAFSTELKFEPPIYFLMILRGKKTFRMPANRNPRSR
jgi:hypothetical protein